MVFRDKSEALKTYELNKKSECGLPCWQANSERSSSAAPNPVRGFNPQVRIVAQRGCLQW
jgi:hypothetical protein